MLSERTERFKHNVGANLRLLDTCEKWSRASSGQQ